MLKKSWVREWNNEKQEWSSCWKLLKGYSKVTLIDHQIRFKWQAPKAVCKTMKNQETDETVKIFFFFCITTQINGLTDKSILRDHESMIPSNTSNDDEVVLTPDELMRRSHVGLAHGTRKVCWKLGFRGVYGETLLHILIICDTELHTRIAKALIRRFPALVHDVFESDEYYGECGL